MPRGSVTPVGTVLLGRRILIVEDDYLIALGLSDILTQAGAEVVGPIGFVPEAVAFVEAQADSFDAAVLDVNMHGRKTYPVADALAVRGIRFVFTTGYGADALDPAYRGYPRCDKPVDRSALLAALTAEV
jgi:CheY-like chemotaxis protein